MRSKKPNLKHKNKKTRFKKPKTSDEINQKTKLKYIKIKQTRTQSKTT